MNLLVKLGGSLINADLAPWIDVLIQPGQRRHLVVPGGGSFADAVRTAQVGEGGELRFSDAAAHDMAILAMHQFGLMLSERLVGYQRLLRVADIKTQVSAQGTKSDAAMDNGVWLPDPHELAADPNIPASWDMTSDALAVWLAATLKIDEVVLVKSVAAQQLNAPLPQLEASGHVDALCGQFGNRFGVTLHVVGAGQHSRLREILALV